MTDEKKFTLKTSLDNDQAKIMCSILANMFGFDGPNGEKLVTVTKEQFESLPEFSDLSMDADLGTGIITLKLEACENEL